jgi:hypothetical protein
MRGKGKGEREKVKVRLKFDNGYRWLSDLGEERDEIVSKSPVLSS